LPASNDPSETAVIDQFDECELNTTFDSCESMR